MFTGHDPNLVAVADVQPVVLLGVGGGGGQQVVHRHAPPREVLQPHPAGEQE
jgi:hypothetical protein